MSTPSEPEFIVSAEQLEPVLARWQQAEFLALDTEFVREQTYYPQACLVQVSDSQTCSCVDLLSLEASDRLFSVLLEAGRVRVLHAASQDLGIFYQLHQALPSPLFDTQVAAAMLGLGDQIGYAGLVKSLRGIELDKSLSRTNWARRPLKAKEIAYATDDVRHLADLYPEIVDKLQQRGRLAWLEQDCASLADPARYQPQAELAWKRLKGLARLARADQQVAAKLTYWREHEAMRRDRPRKWILPDDAVYAVAERHPRSLDELARLDVIAPKTIERHADAILQCVAEGLDDPAPALASDDRADETRKRQLKWLGDRLKQLAQALELPPSLLATRADLDTLLRDRDAADIALLRGWRYEQIGQQMLAALPDSAAPSN